LLQKLGYPSLHENVLNKGTTTCQKKVYRNNRYIQTMTQQDRNEKLISVEKY
jgi:hypothetical protein